MAQLAKKACPGDWSFDGDWDKRHSEQYKKLEEAASRVDPDVSLVDALVSFPWADGSAIYRITKDKPLILQHVPVHDAWEVPYPQIRGLRRADAVAMVKAVNELNKLFAPKA